MVILGQFCRGEGAASPRHAGKNSANQMGVGRERERQLILGGNKWGSREGGTQGLGVGCCSGCGVPGRGVPGERLRVRRAARV